MVTDDIVDDARFAGIFTSLKHVTDPKIPKIIDSPGTSIKYLIKKVPHTLPQVHHTSHNTQTHTQTVIQNSIVHHTWYIVGLSHNHTTEVVIE